MAREDQHFRLRIPDTLKARIEGAAAENHRSMTAEIISRLEASFAVPDPSRYTSEEMRALISSITLQVIAVLDEKARAGEATQHEG